MDDIAISSNGIIIFVCGCYNRLGKYNDINFFSWGNMGNMDEMGRYRRL